MKDRKVSITLIMFFCTLFIFSCKHWSNSEIADYSNVSTIKYNDKYGQKILRDSAISNIKYVKLETKENCLIGHVDQIIVVDSTIIISDKDIAKSLFLFDIKGRFLRKVSAFGKGPREYLSLSHIFMTPHNMIAVYDRLKSRIMIFDLKGNYQRTIICPIPCNNLEYIDNQTFAFNIYSANGLPIKHFDDYSYGVTDTTFNPIMAFGEDIYSSDFTVSRLRNLYSYGGNIYCTVNFENTIYQLTKDSVIAKYKLILGTEDYVENIYRTNDEFKSYIDNNPFFNGDFVELKDYTYLSYSEDLFEKPFLIFDHQSKITYNLMGIGNNFLLNYVGSPYTRYKDNTLVECVPINKIVSRKELLLSMSDNDPALLELYKGLTLDSNPVLFFYDIDIKE